MREDNREKQGHASGERKKGNDCLLFGSCFICEEGTLFDFLFWREKIYVEQ